MVRMLSSVSVICFSSSVLAADSSSRRSRPRGSMPTSRMVSVPATEPSDLALISCAARQRPPTMEARRPWQRMLWLASTMECRIPSLATTFCSARTWVCSMNLVITFCPAVVFPWLRPRMPWWTMMSPSASSTHLPTLPSTSMFPAAFTWKPSSTLPFT